LLKLDINYGLHELFLNLPATPLYVALAQMKEEKDMKAHLAAQHYSPYA
jgi:hypothetical protein